MQQTKQRVLAILKVHDGTDLESALARSVTEEDEDEWARVVDLMTSQAGSKLRLPSNRPVGEDANDIFGCVTSLAGGYTLTQNLNTIAFRSMSFHQLKMATLGDILHLRQLGLVRKDDKYQSILNGIAHDMRSKRESVGARQYF